MLHPISLSLSVCLSLSLSLCLSLSLSLSVSLFAEVPDLPLAPVLHMQNAQGETPCAMAAHRRLMPLLRRLWQLGADLNFGNSRVLAILVAQENQQAIREAIQSYHADVPGYLVDRVLRKGRYASRFSCSVLGPRSHAIIANRIRLLFSTQLTHTGKRLIVRECSFLFSIHDSCGAGLLVLVLWYARASMILVSLCSSP